MKKLTSLQNPTVKSLVILKHKASFRKEKEVFLIEGRKEILLALRGGYDIKRILFYPEICSASEIKKWPVNTELIEINKEIFQKLAYRNSTEGVIAVAKMKNLGLKRLRLGSNPLILIAEALEKPGNIGALLRTADAAKIDAVIIANPKSDLYNPNVVRSSMGCLFTNQIAVGTTSEAISFLKDKKIPSYCATLQNSNAYHTVDYNKPVAIVVGAESNGLSQEWRDSSRNHIVIPMLGEIDSMNVSVSAAILLFEAKRQRGF